MSYLYKNPINDYRSYSYHFILSVSNNSETFRKILNYDSLNQTFASSKDIKNTKPGDIIHVNKDEDMKFIVLLDSRKNPFFSIKDLEIIQMLNPIEGNVLSTTAPIVIQIEDVYSFTFIELLKKSILDDLDSNIINSTFLLSIEFIGHKYDDRTEIISTSNILLSLADIAFNQNNTSQTSSYTLTFFDIEGIDNIAKRTGANKDLYSLNEVSSISIPLTSNTLEDACNRLESKLNDKAFKDFKSTLIAEDNNNTSRGRLVQYMITLPDEWKKFTIDTSKSNMFGKKIEIDPNAATVTGPPIPSPLDALTIGTAGEMYFSFEAESTILSAIDLILNNSLELLQLNSNKARKSGSSIVPKVLISISSNNNSIIVHYDIIPFYAPIQKEAQTNNMMKVNVGSDNVLNYTQDIPSNAAVINLDYAFTGRNIEVKSLDMRYQNGIILLTDPIKNNDITKQKEISNKGQKQQIDEPQNKTIIAEKALFTKGSPIIFGKNIFDSKKINKNNNENVSKEEATRRYNIDIEYKKNLALLSTISSIEIDLTIKGNPDLIRKLISRDSKGGVPPHCNFITNTQYNSLSGKKNDSSIDKELKTYFQSSKQEYEQTYIKPRIESIKNSTNGNTILESSDISVIPLFVKINAKRPNVDFSGAKLSAEEYKNSDFLFKDYFIVMGVISKFSNGDFTQTLKIMPYIFGNISSSQEEIEVDPYDKILEKRAIETKIESDENKKYEDKLSEISKINSRKYNKGS